MKNTLKDLTGQKFGKLIVINRNKDNSKSGNARWNCICDCGNKAVVIGSKLRSGYTKSCGCIRVSDNAQGYSDTRLYNIWYNMHRRCYDKNHDAYKWYGKKGVKVCKDWHEFINFRKWALDNGYDEKLSIDRIDSFGDYKPSNCRWKTQKQQMNNVSSNKIIKYAEKEYTQSQFAEKFDLNYHTVRNRLRLGWDLERIISTPEAGGSV